jgi:hypothetical protein
LEEEGYAPILREAGLELDVEDERETPEPAEVETAH